MRSLKWRNSKIELHFCSHSKRLTTSGFLTMTDFYCSLANCICILSPVVIENNEILYRDYVDISVAVATPKVCAASGPDCLKFGITLSPNKLLSSGQQFIRQIWLSALRTTGAQFLKQLGLGIHKMIVTKSFSISSVVKMFSIHTKNDNGLKRVFETLRFVTDSCVRQA